MLKVVVSQRCWFWGFESSCLGNVGSLKTGNSILRVFDCRIMHMMQYLLLTPPPQKNNPKPRIFCCSSSSLMPTLRAICPGLNGRKGLRFFDPFFKGSDGGV